MEQVVHEKFRTTIDQLPPSADLALRSALGLAAGGDLWHQVASRSHAEVTLALLAAGHIGAAEQLIGRPISRAPASGGTRDWWATIARLQAQLTAPPRPPGRGGAVILRVDPRPRARNSPLTPPVWHSLLQVGQTVAQALARGVPRRELNRAIAEGWLTIQETQVP